jgi:Ni,Fe-hydrogenase maturation factor
MTVFVFGNPDLETDSLPLRLLPKLRQEFPEIKFEVKDPNEEWPEIEFENVLTVIDTVVRIKDVAIFDDLEKFKSAPRVSMHDFDALTNLRLLQKLGKIKKVKIIGISPEISEGEAFKKVSATLR